MIARAFRWISRWRRLSRTQWAGALVAVTASLVAVSLPGGAARADSTPGYNQMTGVGPTASAVTVPWTAGILDNTNTAIASANADRIAASPTEPYSFMYKDFKNLVVTVSQTQDIAHQGITVSWTGGQPTVGAAQENFLQMMECWGDASSGPTPEQCQYGSLGLLPGGANGRIGQRYGGTCPPGAVASTTSPPASANGDSAIDGCDPQEPGSNADQIAPCPGPYCEADTYTIPFSPVTDPTDYDYAGASDTTYYSEFNTDEIQEAVTQPGGTGQVQFETLTGTQAPGLGCGEAESGNTPRGCWLVIVPRGTYEPNGYQINPNNRQSFIDTSPLSASNWAQRIQIHLGFSPVGSFCPPGTLEIQTFGTQIVARAMQSWQLALNQAGGCKQVYGYSAVPESTVTQNLGAGGDVGLAFTTIPVGSEAARDGEPAPTDLPTILYAPVAIAAVDFGFNINYQGTDVTTPVKLTPLLLAKALTQSYKFDLPDFLPPGSDGPSWAAGNPLNISYDPTFQALNPGIPDSAGPTAPLLTEDHSGPNQQVWAWIQGSSAATTWLAGTADASDQNMAIDTDYQALKLGQAPPIDSFPRAYTGILSQCQPSDSTGASPSPACAAGLRLVEKRSLDLLPYTDNYDSAARAVLGANNPDENGGWDVQAVAPDGSAGWWDKQGVEPIGAIWMWGASDTPDLAAYGLVPANLCNDVGQNCVGPTIASVTAAVTAATPDAAGLLQVNPASPGTGGYPLTQIIYAAVATNQSAAALTNYAALITDAVGAGQTTGTTPGDLPPGYLPLPSNLVSQAKSVVSQLQALASPSPSPSTSSSTSSPTPSSSSSFSSSTQAQNTTTTAASQTTAASTSTSAAAGSVTPTPTPAAAATTAPAANVKTSPVNLGTIGSSYRAVALSTPTTPGPVISLPQAQVAAGTTPQQAVGAFRWVLIGVAIVGGGFAGGGTLLRAGPAGLLIWRRRRLL